MMMLRRLLLLLLLSTAAAWQWTDFLQTGNHGPPPSTLTRAEIQLMRVRDLKRHLARQHGYAADELGRMLDKKELMAALEREENRVRQRYEQEVQRTLFWDAVIVTVVAGLVVLCWPLLHHIYKVAAVNLVVYTDRKYYEATRVWELQSLLGAIGFAAMCLVDMLQVWLTASVALSWVMARSRYFFPTPNLPLRPAQFMGDQVAQSSVASYGINVGPMVVTWALRFLQGRLETATGQVLLRAQKAQRQAARETETEEERAARKAARKQAKRAAKEEAEVLRQQAMVQPPPSMLLPKDWMQSPESVQPIPMSSEHNAFLMELDEHALDEIIQEPTPLDDLD